MQFADFTICICITGGSKNRVYGLTSYFNLYVKAWNYFFSLFFFEKNYLTVNIVLCNIAIVLFKMFR